MDAPTLVAVRARSALFRERLPVSVANDAILSVQVGDAAGQVSMLTGRAIGVTGAGPFGCTLDEVPAGLTGLASRVVTLVAERLYVTETSRTAEMIESELVSASDNLASFSAGPYSEAYFAPGQVVEMKRLDPDPERAGLLWALATDCVRLGWTRLWFPDSIAAQPSPVSALVELNWFPEGSSGRFFAPYLPPDSGF